MPRSYPLQHLATEPNRKRITPCKVQIGCMLALCLLAAICPFARAASLRCLTCHSARGLSKITKGKRVSLYVDPHDLESSVHAARDCLECHVDFRGQPLPHKQTADAVQCVWCHHQGNNRGAPDITNIEMYADSVHGSALRNGDTDAPDCAACHGTHGIRRASDPKSTIYRARIPDTCGRCHFSPAFARRHNLASVRRYKDSVHARAVQTQGLMKAAVCTDCHGVHDITAPNQAESSVNKPNVPATCGKCHQRIFAVYRESIHGKAVADGVKDAPVCTNCHGEHTIQRPSTPESTVYPTHVVATCSKCHEDVKLQRRYRLPAGRLSSYIGSYHGVANRYGDVTVANCASCHGAHSVLPSTDPRSPVNKRNLPRTCGKCHPGAGENFAKGSIHVLPSLRKDVVVFWVQVLYTALVAGLIGSFCGYIALDLFARWRGRLGRLPAGASDAK